MQIVPPHPWKISQQSMWLKGYYTNKQADEWMGEWMDEYRPIRWQLPQLKVLKVQMLYSSVTVSGMSHGQGLHRNLKELPSATFYLNSSL